MDTEINEIVNEIMSLAPEAPEELTEADKSRIEAWLSEEITEMDQQVLMLLDIVDKLDAGAPISNELAVSGLHAALEQADCLWVFNNMLLAELNDLYKKNQRLAAIVYPAGVITESGIVGNA